MGSLLKAPDGETRLVGAQWEFHVKVAIGARTCRGCDPSVIIHVLTGGAGVPVVGAEDLELAVLTLNGASGETQLGKVSDTLDTLRETGDIATYHLSAFLWVILVTSFKGFFSF